MEFFESFIRFCQEEDSIRALALQGSRVYSKNKVDRYSDYDVIVIVADIKKYTATAEWLKTFGEILIMQKPDDWYDHKYDYKGRDPYTYLVQYKDGNRLDINLFDQRNLEKLKADKEPRKVLLAKDGIGWFKTIEPGDFHKLTKPSPKEFSDTINEFYWLSLYVAKGIKRGEVLYVRDMYENYFMPMLYKMIAFEIGCKHDFNVSVGKSYKYFADYLDDLELIKLWELLPQGDLYMVKDKLIKALDFFDRYAKTVGEKLGYEQPDYQEIKNYIIDNY